MTRFLVVWTVVAASIHAQDADGDGLPDGRDPVPRVSYEPRFDWRDCPPLNLDPGDNVTPQGKARERIARFLANENAPVSRIAFAIVVDGEVHFADAFERRPDRAIRHDPGGIHRLFRVGSTTKPMVAVTAKALEERGALSFTDHVDDADGTRKASGGQVTLRQLLTHRGAFKRGDGHIQMYCFPGDLQAFWRVSDEVVSPLYGSARYGNLFGGFNYSGFNYSLAGTYLQTQTQIPFEDLLQALVFSPSRMATAMLDATRANAAPVGGTTGRTRTSQMHIGPYINLVAPSDPHCIDNYYSSGAIFGQTSYMEQSYRLDECAADPRDPAGGVVASVVDVAHFARELIAVYRGTSGLISRRGLLDLWSATHDYGCGSNCPYQRYYATGFFVDAPNGMPVKEVEHGGSRAGYNSVFVLRPESGVAISVLVNANVDLTEMNRVGKRILDDLEAPVRGALEPYGQGCPATGPTLSAMTPPTIGQQLQIDLRARPLASLSVFLFGDSRRTWDGTELPIDLAWLGAPGCQIHAAAQITSPVAVDPWGRAGVAFVVPRDPGLVGTSLFVQAAVVDPSANTLGLAWTPGARVWFGR